MLELVERCAELFDDLVWLRQGSARGEEGFNNFGISGSSWCLEPGWSRSRVVEASDLYWLPICPCDLETGAILSYC